MNLYNQHFAISHPVLKIIMHLFLVFFQFQRISFILFAKFINLKLPIVNKSLRDYNLFTHVYSEMLFKLRIMNKWPTLLAILNSRVQSSNYIFLFQVYSKLYSGLTFMIMDTLIGFVFTYALYTNAQNLLNFIHFLFRGTNL